MIRKLNHFRIIIYPITDALNRQPLKSNRRHVHRPWSIDFYPLDLCTGVAEEDILKSFTLNVIFNNI